jgi:DNA repair protein RadD
MPEANACILAHRDELTAQNRAKFGRVNPGLDTSVFDARQKMKNSVRSKTSSTLT